MEPTAGIVTPPFYKSKKFIILLFVVISILIPVGAYILKTYFLKTIPTE